MPNPTPPRLLVFDLGRVMIGLCSGWADACRRAGVAYPANLETPARRDPMLSLLKRYETGRLDRPAWARQAADIAGLPAADLLAIMSHWLDAPFPGWDALLDDLGRWSGQTACLSNTHELHWELMTTRTGPHALPLHRLHHRFASHLVGAHKPEPAIFRHVETAAGVAPDQILFFDDAPANIRGAQACGWQTHLIDVAQDPVSQVRAALRQRSVLA